MVKDFLKQAKSVCQRALCVTTAITLMTSCAWGGPALKRGRSAPRKPVVLNQTVGTDSAAFVDRVENELLKITKGNALVIFSQEDIRAARKIMGDRLPDGWGQNAFYAFDPVAEIGRKSLAENGLVVSGDVTQEDLARALRESPLSYHSMITEGKDIPYGAGVLEKRIGWILVPCDKKDENRLADYVDSHKGLTQAMRGLFAKEEIGKIFDAPTRRSLATLFLFHESVHTQTSGVRKKDNKINACVVYDDDGLLQTNQKKMAKIAPEGPDDILEFETLADIKAVKRAQKAGFPEDAIVGFLHYRAAQTYLNLDYDHVTQFELGKKLDDTYPRLDGQDAPRAIRLLNAKLWPSLWARDIKRGKLLGDEKPWTKEERNRAILGTIKKAYDAGFFANDPDVQKLAESIARAVDYFASKNEEIRASFFPEEAAQKTYVQKKNAAPSRHLAL